MKLVTVEDIRAAAVRIGPRVVRTPLLAMPSGDEQRPLWLKPENLQPIGAFKLRGAFNAIEAAIEAATETGGLPSAVVAYSSGNHAQAVACAAATYRLPAHIVMPEETPSVKVRATRGYGANVVLCAAGEREAVAARVLAETGGLLIPPFDHRDVIAGQGTIGLEIAADLPVVRNVLIPVSGGGLASGIGVALRALCPQAQIFGVEPELAADTADGLTRGRCVDWPIEDRNRTIADGLRSQPSDLTFAHLQQVLDGIITVREDEICSAVSELAHRVHLVSEPSGAAAMAAYRRGSTPPGPTVVIVSGGNIEPQMFLDILTHYPAD